MNESELERRINTRILIVAIAKQETEGHRSEVEEIRKVLRHFAPFAEH